MDDTPTDRSVTDSEGLMFAPTPVWERGRKRRGLGGGKRAGAASPTASEPIEPTAEPRSFEEPMTLDRPISAGVDPLERPMAASQPAMRADEPARRPLDDDLRDEDAATVAPIGRPRAARTTSTERRTGVSMAALAAGVVALGALGAVGWVATQDRDGVPELTPGSAEVATTTPSTTIPATAMPTTETARLTPTPPRAETVTTTERRTTTTQMASANRIRPAARAAAPSTADTGVSANVAATLPAGPQPYSAMASSASTTAPAATDTPEPATAPSATPAPIPDTPPINPGPAETSPSPADASVTPPQ